MRPYSICGIAVKHFIIYLLQQARVLLARCAVTSQSYHIKRPTYLGQTTINDTEKDPVTNSMRPEKVKEGRRQT